MSRVIRIVLLTVLFGLGFIMLQMRGCSSMKIKADITLGDDDSPIATATVKRANLLVSDIERSLALYGELLGLIPNEIKVLEADSYSYPAFNIPAQASLRTVTLDDKSDSRAMALTEVSGIELPMPQNTPYMSTVVIGVSDLSEKFETLEALGLNITQPRTVAGTEFIFIEQAFTDYDGHLIVLYEILKDDD